MIQEAWIGGVSTRRVDDLVQAMGLSGISKSQVSKLCKDIDERVHAFLDRPLIGEWPYLWLDATYLKQREGGRDCLGRGDNRCGGEHRRQARDCRAAHRTFGGGDFLVRLSQEPCAPRAAWREAGDIGCA